MQHSPLLSCVYLLDEFPWNHHVPWKASLASALRVADEVVVMLGNRKHSSKDIPVRHYLEELDGEAKLKIVSLPWPENWDWMFIAQALNIGLFHTSGRWVCRLLMDEIFPDDMGGKVRRELSSPGGNVRWCQRDYVLGRNKLYAAGMKPFFFRRGCRYVYGRVAPTCGDAVIFDNPVMLNAFSACQLLLTSEKNYVKRWPSPPLGTRQWQEKEGERLAIYNTDVDFYSMEHLLAQKFASTQGYARLPAEYKRFTEVTADKALANHMEKIRRFLESGRCFSCPDMPQSILEFFDTTDRKDAPVLDILLQYQ